MRPIVFWSLAILERCNASRAFSHSLVLHAVCESKSRVQSCILRSVGLLVLSWASRHPAAEFELFEFELFRRRQFRGPRAFVSLLGGASCKTCRYGGLRGQGGTFLRSAVHGQFQRSSGAPRVSWSCLHDHKTVSLQHLQGSEKQKCSSKHRSTAICSIGQHWEPVISRSSKSEQLASCSIHSAFQ